MARPDSKRKLPHLRKPPETGKPSNFPEDILPSGTAILEAAANGIRLVPAFDKNGKPIITEQVLNNKVEATVTSPSSISGDDIKAEVALRLG